MTEWDIIVSHLMLIGSGRVFVPSEALSRLPVIRHSQHEPKPKLNQVKKYSRPIPTGSKVRADLEKALNKPSYVNGMASLYQTAIDHKVDYNALIRYHKQVQANKSE